LVDEFYANMERLPEAQIIRAMHPADLTESRRKLAYFLCGWLGGPKLFQQHYGPISIPGAHKRFPIGYEERDAWLLCMQRALAVQPYSTELKDYLLAALSIPAERVRQVNAGEI
jgi:hemoglobin